MTNCCLQKTYFVLKNRCTEIKENINEKLKTPYVNESKKT